MSKKRGVLTKRFLNMFMAVVLLMACIFAVYPGSIAQADEAEQGNTYYVSPSGNDGWSGKLANPNGGGTDGPFKTIAKANQTVQAGDTVIIRGGSYEDPICPGAAGTEDSPIVYKNYDGEKVTIYRGKPISGLTPEEENLIGGDDYGLYIYGKSYITIEGIHIDFTSMGDEYESRWGRIVNSDHITLKNVVFRHTTIPGTSGGICFINSHYNTIQGCTFDDGNDNLILVQSDYNLIEGSIFTKGRHTLWCIRAGSYNILRNNYFHNEIQKIGEIYDNGAYSAKKYGTIEQDAAKHNIVENNVFAYTPHGSDGPYNGIQFAGQDCIIRGNIFYDNYGGGLGMAIYEDEAYYNYNNRVYNNTFVNNQCGGISLTRASETSPGNFFYNNIFKNNILSNNIYTEEGDRHNYSDWLPLRGKPVQIWGVRKDGFTMSKNVIYSSDPDYAVAFGDNTEHHSVSWMESNYPYLYSNNVTNIEPEFVKFDTDYDPSVPYSADHDFTLKEGSPLIDGGEFLTTVLPLMVKGKEESTSGKSSVISVRDPLYFSDGFGIVEGDTIKLQNGETAVITDIVYGIRHNRITLDREVNWSKGMGISLVYGGTAPDMGAIEIGVPRAPVPTPTETPTPAQEAVKITGPSVIRGLEPFSVVYSLENAADITAQIVTVSYDKDKFTFEPGLDSVKSIREGTSVFETKHNAVTGTITIILASFGKENAINGNADILELVFEPRADAIGPGTISVTASLSDSTGKKFNPAEAGVSIEVAGKGALASKIAEAQEIYNHAEEGTAINNYPAGSKSVLNDAINEAIAVRDDENATVAQILQAIGDLNDAVAWFQSLIITASTGDIDAEEGFGVGDLGMIAGYYGAKAGDPEWDQIKRADINGDGEIGLYELAFIARRIIESL